MKLRFFVIPIILFFATFFLVGCGVPRSDDPGQTFQKTEPPSKDVEAIERVAPPIVIEKIEAGFEAIRKKLLECGILKKGVVVYQFGQVVENDDRFALDSFFWGKEDIVIVLRFFQGDGRNEYGRTWSHRVRLIADGRERIPFFSNHHTLEDGHVISYLFRSPRTPKPDYALVFVKTRMSPEEETEYRFGLSERSPKSMDGDIPFIIQRVNMLTDK